MEIVRRVHSMKEIADRARGRGLRIGFVPTMGSLHEGHLTLIRKTDELADVVVVSSFVNPAQFGPGEDFERYPRDPTGDADLCVAEGVDYLFAPDPENLYPPGPRTFVEVEGLSARLEGASRPGHFRGVTTIVSKLLQVVRPHVVTFGAKDAQQAIVVKRMVVDLMFDVEVLVLPTVRDDDGLALSSRNRYLSPEQRTAAQAIPRALEAARQRVTEGGATPEEVVAAARAPIEAQELLQIDYLELVDGETLEPVETLDGEALLVLAVDCGETRLLDNTTVRP
ncbi:MAG: pantoate--beta-alanine ligase [bacterium]|nr:pantoate--beta-alanine ligase [bacterium]